MAGPMLIVDDSDMVRQQVARTLAAAGFQVVEARDGADALARLTGSEPGPALIVLDLNMPNMGGIEFLQASARVRAARICPW